MPRAGQHSWSEPHREERHTDRACWHCGLTKRTRHEGDRHWIEFHARQSDGSLQRVPGKHTPPCPGTPDQSQIDFSPPRNTMTNGDAHEAHH